MRFATDKADSKRISSDIRGVLLNFWDPIGIKNEPIAQDEYNSYSGGVYELLKRSCTDEELAAHLWKIIAERIEIQPAKRGNREDSKRASADKAGLGLDRGSS